MMEKLLTVIIQTSPLPSHPSTSLIDALFHSFDRVDGLKNCTIVILCDGCDRDEAKTQSDDRTCKQDNEGSNYKHGSTLPTETVENYRIYIQQLRDKISTCTPPYCPSNNGSIRLLELPKRYGSANALEAVFDIIANPSTIHEFTCTESNKNPAKLEPTPFVMIGQHDNFFVKDVNYLSDILQYMQQHETALWLQCLHFPSTATLNYVEKIKRRYQLDLQPFCREYNYDSRMKGILVPLVFWYGRTHIARWEYYTKKILDEYPLKSGDHLEEIWGTSQLHSLMELKKKNHNEDFRSSFRDVHSVYGNYVFFESDTQQEVLYHLSGRKARAASSATDSYISSITATCNKQKQTTFNPHENSFTTARSAAALVPGISVVSPKSPNNAPKGRFKQRCFQCGEKGHSKNYCPEFAPNDKDSKDAVEILNLS
jgi:hypothetical protein